jgi:hypothetical protein
VQVEDPVAAVVVPAARQVQLQMRMVPAQALV